MEQIEVTIERNIWGHPPGLREIRFSNEDVIQNIEGVYEELRNSITAINSCGGSSRSARPDHRLSLLPSRPGTVQGTGAATWHGHQPGINNTSSVTYLRKYALGAKRDEGREALLS